jgi:hypothetical protein
MNIDPTTRFIAQLILAVLLIGASVWFAQSEIIEPDWLSTATSTAILFLFGLSTKLPEK